MCVQEEVVSLFAKAAGAVLGALLACTREALGWMHIDLGPGVTFGVIAGVLVFVASGGNIFLAVLVGVAVGAVTAALIKSRPMNDEEKSWARLAFGDALNLEKVRLTNMAGLGGRAFTAPGLPN